MPELHFQLPLGPSGTGSDPLKSDWRTLHEIPRSQNSKRGAVLIQNIDGQRHRLKCTVPKCRYRATLIDLEQAQRRGLEHASRHRFGPSHQPQPDDAEFAQIPHQDDVLQTDATH